MFDCCFCMAPNTRGITDPHRDIPQGGGIRSDKFRMESVTIVFLEKISPRLDCGSAYLGMAYLQARGADELEERGIFKWKVFPYPDDAEKTSPKKSPKKRTV